MSDMTDEIATDHDGIARFWEVARHHAGIDGLGVVVGASALGVVPPEAWSFGDSPALADELLALVLSGRKHATATAVWELQAAGEPMPQVGTLSIALDGAGRARALLRTTSVRVAAFDEVDEEFAAAEGEDDLTLESWRREHEKYWRRRAQAPGGQPFSPSMPIVLEEFEVRFQAPAQSELPQEESPQSETLRPDSWDVR